MRNSGQYGGSRLMMECYQWIGRIVTIFFMALVLVACSSEEPSLQGYIEGDYAYISSAVSGHLTSRLVNRGDQVKIGQPLFILDSQPETAKLEQAQSQLTQARQKLIDLQKGARSTVLENIQAQLAQKRAGLDLARQTFERYQALYQDAAVDKSSFDQAKTQYDEKLQIVKSAEAQLAEARLGAREDQIAGQKSAVDAAVAVEKQAQWMLLQKSIVSSVDAQVFDTLYEPGEFVAAGQPVVVLLPTDKIKVIFFVPEKILSEIVVGEEVLIDCDSCKNRYKAKIRFISPSAEYTPPVIFSKDSREKLVYRVEAVPVHAGKFHPGQPVDIIFPENKHEKFL